MASPVVRAGHRRKFLPIPFIDSLPVIQKIEKLCWFMVGKLQKRFTLDTLLGLTHPLPHTVSERRVALSSEIANIHNFLNL